MVTAPPVRKVRASTSVALKFNHPKFLTIHLQILRFVYSLLSDPPPPSANSNQHSLISWSIARHS